MVSVFILYLYFENAWSRSSLTRAWFLMFLARLANLSVDKDSGKDSRAGEIMAIIVVLQLPPRLYVVKYVAKYWV